jgi:hypothetical protein
MKTEILEFIGLGAQYSLFDMNSSPVTTSEPDMILKVEEGSLTQE